MASSRHSRRPYCSVTITASMPLLSLSLSVAILLLLISEVVDARGIFEGGYAGTLDEMREDNKDPNDFLPDTEWTLDRRTTAGKNKAGGILGSRLFRSDGEEEDEDDAVIRAASDAISGKTTVRFTKVRADTDESSGRSGNKRICLFSTGERGYWRVTRPRRNFVGDVFGRNPKKNEDDVGGDVDEDDEVGAAVKPYEDAIACNPRGQILEIEVLTRRKSSLGGAGADEGPVLLYQIPIAFGRVQQNALVNDVPGAVRLIPPTAATEAVREHMYTEDMDLIVREGSRLGSVTMGKPHGRSLVDPSWARGRRWFYRGRSRGNL